MCDRVVNIDYFFGDHHYFFGEIRFCNLYTKKTCLYGIDLQEESKSWLMAVGGYGFIRHCKWVELKLKFRSLSPILQKLK